MFFFSRPKTYLEAKLISEGAFGSYLVRIAGCDWAGTGLCTLEPHGVWYHPLFRQFLDFSHFHRSRIITAQSLLDSHEKNNSNSRLWLRWHSGDSRLPGIPTRSILLMRADTWYESAGKSFAASDRWNRLASFLPPYSLLPILCYSPV